MQLITLRHTDRLVLARTGQMFLKGVKYTVSDAAAKRLLTIKDGKGRFRFAKADGDESEGEAPIDMNAMPEDNSGSEEDVIEV